MILSASRRTDIPSLYGEWLIHRLRDGEVLIPNPYRAGQATRLCFSPETVDCIVFWTKNPIPFERYLSVLEELGYPNYYFQYTITAFDREWEPNLPPVEERIDAFRRLSERLGPMRVDWRFDPIVLDDFHSPKWYAGRFQALCERLAPYTDRCILSFVDHYAHLGKAFPDTSPKSMQAAAALLFPIADRYGLPLFTCAEAADLSAYHIRKGSCIDRDKIERLIGSALSAKKDPGQRTACGCVESIDIGSYNTCVNGCAYCYATKSRGTALRNFQGHNPRPPQLGQLSAADVIREKSPPSLKSGQTTLF